MSGIPVIAIDGPSASGKGTVAERVARVLGFHFLDSGALYRLTALSAMKHGVALDDEAGVATLAAALPAPSAVARCGSRASVPTACRATCASPMRWR